MLKDECVLDYDGSPVKVNGKDVTLLQWLALQSKSIGHNKDTSEIQYNKIN